MLKAKYHLLKNFAQMVPIVIYSKVYYIFKTKQQNEKHKNAEI